MLKMKYCKDSSTVCRQVGLMFFMGGSSQQMPHSAAAATTALLYSMAMHRTFCWTDKVNSLVICLVFDSSLLIKNTATSQSFVDVLLTSQNKRLLSFIFLTTRELTSGPPSHQSRAGDNLRYFY